MPVGDGQRPHSGEYTGTYPGQLRYLSAHTGRSWESPRPLPVTLIAVFQFAKCWFLLLIVAIERFAPDAMRALPMLPAMTYLAAHGRSTNGLLLPAIAIYVGATGWGLWRLRWWARRSLIVSTAVMLLVWANRFFVDWRSGETTLKSGLAERTVYTLLFLDAVVFLYLAVHDDVTESFAEKR